MTRSPLHGQNSHERTEGHRQSKDRNPIPIKTSTTTKQMQQETAEGSSNNYRYPDQIDQEFEYLENHPKARARLRRKLYKSQNT